MSLDAIIKIGPLILFAGLVSMAFFYVRGRMASASGHAPGILRYLGAAALVGGIAYVAGTAVGIYGACSSPDSGNLCGLYGVFGLGPLFSGVAIFLYALSWARRAG